MTAASNQMAGLAINEKIRGQDPGFNHGNGERPGWYLYYAGNKKLFSAGGALY